MMKISKPGSLVRMASPYFNDIPKGTIGLVVKRIGTGAVVHFPPIGCEFFLDLHLEVLDESR